MTMGGVTPKERRRRGKRNSPRPSAGKKPSNNHPAKTKIAHETKPSKRGAASTSTPGYKPHSTLLVQFTEETPTWYDCGKNTAGRGDTIFSTGKKHKKQQTHGDAKNTREIVSKYRQLADDIYSQEVSLSRQSLGGDAVHSEKDEKWVENTMKRGTLKDRVAAMSVVAGNDCVHKLHALDMLLDLAGCGLGGEGAVPNSRVGQMASEALSDLFVNTLLPQDRKLIPLDHRPLYLYEGVRTLSPRVLLLWRFEEMVKLRYASYLSRYIGKVLAGEDETSKKNALTTASVLLMQRPEGEESLLTMVVNKIGDPCRSIACAASHQLRLVLDEHPAMVKIVAREVQQLTHRPHLSPRALYNCVVFLNQLQLSREDEETTPNEKNTQKETSLAASLINTYFQLFETNVKKDEKKGQSNPKDESSGTKSRLLSALLTGVNRAHPFLQKDALVEQHIDKLYRISHTAPPAAATQALMLLFQLAVGSGDPEGDPHIARQEGTGRKDRFYRALYSKLADGDMYSGRQLTLFFNLLYKAMKYDTSIGRVSAFSKRLLHTVLHLPSSLICGSLFLFSEIVRCHPKLQSEVGSMASELLFDPTKREPTAVFDGKFATTKNLWELSLLAHHFHPSVSMFTAGSDGEISYSGDPLKDFALSPFLDKFAFKNPKSLNRLCKQLKRGESIAERKSGLSSNMALPMNDPSYLESNKISEEETFFHHFFTERAKRDKIKGIVRGRGTDKEKDDSALEDEALNATEADEAAEIVDNLEGDTDSEEEAFVHRLAEKMMESAANGKANLDEEDPDMDDWSDFDDGNSDQEDGSLVVEEDDGSIDGNGLSLVGIDDSPDGDTNLHVGSFNEDGSDDGSIKQPSKRVDNRHNKRKQPTSIFADAEEYEKKLEEKSKHCVREYQGMSPPEMERVNTSQKKYKKSRKKH